MTEYLVVAIVVFVLLYIIGGGVLTVAGLSLLIVLITMGVLGFFVYSSLLVLKSKKKNATFLNFAENKKYKFKTAVYMIDDEICENLFPADDLIFGRFYKENKSVKVFYITSKNKVFDKISILTIILGLISGIVLLVLTVLFFINISKF